jgi:hypothetical protein
MTEDTIVAVEVQETDYGEKVALQSPFDAKDFIKALPWEQVRDEVSDHGSLAEMAQSGDVAAGAVDAVSDFDFSDDYASHASWDPNAFGYEDGGWTVDADTLDETMEFFEFVGFETENRTNL